MSQSNSDQNNNQNNAVLNAHTLEEIDHWLQRYPDDQKQSAVLASLRAAQHQNDGFLTVELMDAVADKLDMPKIVSSDRNPNEFLLE